MRTDFLPRKDADFNRWFKNFTEYVNGKCTVVPPAAAPEWTHIPEAERAQLNGSCAAWESAYGLTLRPHSPAETLAKNEARDASEGVIRPFVNAFIRYGPITDQERVEAGIRVSGGERRPDTKPEGIPEAVADSSVIRVLTIRFKPAGSLSRAKPGGVHGAELRWAVLDAPPADETDLTNSDFATASPFTLSFHESQRGKRVYFCLRWESRTNIKGDFGEIYSAVIP
jgi:hypothetical protein